MYNDHVNQNSSHQGGNQSLQSLKDNWLSGSL